MNLTKVKHFEVEYREDENSELKTYLKAIATIEKDGEKSDINHSICLDDINLSTFMSADDITALTANLTPNGSIVDSMGVLFNTMKNIIAKKIAYDLGLTLVGDDYVPPLTMREKQEANDLAVAELSILISQIMA